MILNSIQTSWDNVTINLKNIYTQYREGKQCGGKLAIEQGFEDL